MNPYFNKCFVGASALFLCIMLGVSALGYTHEDTDAKTPPFAGLPADAIPSVSIQPITPIDSIVSQQNPQSIQDTVLPPCDIVFYKTGKLEYCKIIETSPTTVSYKMCDYQDGPTVVVNKSDLHKIRYANGREDIIDVKPSVVKDAYSKGNKKDVMATLSFIFGVSGLGILLLFGYLLIPLILASLILGIISLVRINRRRGELRGKGSATLGILFSVIAIALILIFA